MKTKSFSGGKGGKAAIGVSRNAREVTPKTRIPCNENHLGLNEVTCSSIGGTAREGPVLSILRAEYHGPLDFRRGPESEDRY